MEALWRQVKEIYLYREMFRNVVARELRARYKGSVFGFLWTFLNPLLMLVIYSVVFSFVMRVQVEKYPVFLFTALLPWNYLAQSVQQSAASLVRNANLVKKIYFPRAILPLSVVAANMVNYLLGLTILVPALFAWRVELTWAVLAFPLVLVVQSLLVVALALLVSVGNVYFRDLEHITGIFMTVWFFLTPVLYPLEVVPQGLRPVFHLNPATAIIEAYRAVFFYGRWPDWQGMGCLALILVGLLLVAWAVFLRLDRYVAEEV